MFKTILSKLDLSIPAGVSEQQMGQADLNGDGITDLILASSWALGKTRRMLQSFWKRVVTLFVGTLVAALVVAPAQAQEGDPRTKVVYVACYAYQIGNPNSAYLPVVRATQAEVSNYLEFNVERAVFPHRQPGQAVGCSTGDTAEAAHAARVKTGYLKTSELPWPKEVVLASMSPADTAAPKAASAPKPAATPKPVAKVPAQTTALTIKANPGPKDAAKAWDKQVKKTLAAEAQKKVETAAKQAQADANTKADYEAFLRERRKQGRAQ